LSAVFFAGCAPYKLQRGAPPYDKGYAAARDGKVIPEYTVGKDNTLPADIKLAQARFRRRKARVEDYYKKMGGIENRFKENVPNRLGFMAKMAGAVFFPCGSSRIFDRGTLKRASCRLISRRYAAFVTIKIF